MTSLVVHITTSVYQRLGAMIQRAGQVSFLSQSRIDNIEHIDKVDTQVQRQYRKENIPQWSYSLFSWQKSAKNLLISLSLFSLSSFGVAAVADDAAGIQWRTSQFQNHRYISVEIDLDIANLTQTMVNPETGENYGSFSQLKKTLQVEGQSLLFAINSGIYTKEFTPLGLYIESGKQITPLNRVTSNRGKGNFSLLPNGVFYITHDNRARILDTNRFDQRFHQGYADIRDAVQSGPMLLIDGEYNPYFLPKSDSYRIRSGVCALNHGQKVVFVVTEDSVNFYEFARFFKEQLNCENALYLDGTLARIYHQGHVYGASFWQAKPLVGIWSVSKKHH